MTVLIQLPAYPMTGAKPNLQPKKAFMPLHDSKSHQKPRLNQISPDFLPLTRVSVAATAVETSAIDSPYEEAGKSNLPADSRQTSLACGSTLLDTASELHLGLGPFEATSDNLGGGNEVLNEGQLASCSSIPGQIQEEDARWAALLSDRAVLQVPCFT